MNRQVVVAMEKAAIVDKHGLSPNFLRLSVRSSDDQGLGAGAVDTVVTSLMRAEACAAMARGEIDSNV
jgi:hypothetical protein